MDILKIIKSRRSIRKYKPNPVPGHLLNKVLEAARWAPSAMNRQPWHFIVVLDENTKRKVAKYSKLYFVGNRHVNQAPVVIIVCGKVRGNKWAEIDCALASENIMLEAHSLGLGTCFIGAFKEDKLKEILKIPEEVKIIGLITLGYPDGKASETLRKSIDKIVSYDLYQDNEFPIFDTKSGVLSIAIKRIKRK